MKIYTLYIWGDAKKEGTPTSTLHFSDAQSRMKFIVKNRLPYESISLSQEEAKVISPEKPITCHVKKS